MKVIWQGLVLIICVLLSLNCHAQHTKNAFAGAANLVDEHGLPLNAHGGGILYYQGVYYFFGEVKKGKTWLVPKQGWEDYRVPAGGVSCYSSTDLKKWKNLRVVLKSVTGNPDNELDTGRVIERPKVIFNERTNKFVMWFHIDKNDYGYSRGGVAVSDSPAGPYKYVGSVQPNGQMLRDMNLFKDTDGKAYLIYSSEGNSTMHICQLSDDYLSPTKTYSRIFINEGREAPVIFKYKTLYYLITSACTGWSPNAAMYATATNIFGPWKEHGNPCKGRDAEKTFYSQGTSVVQVPGRSARFIFMADTWNKLDLEHSGYLWLPIRLNNQELEIYDQ